MPRAMRESELPSVEHGIPIPLPPPPRKKPRKKPPYRPSPWIKFLKGLRDGDTFRTCFSQHLTAIKYLSQLGIGYEYRRMKEVPGGHYCRIWITKQPWVPEYLNIGIDI